MAFTRKSTRRLLIGIVVAITVLAVSVAIYAGDYYRALPYTVPTMADGNAILIGKYEGFKIYGDSTHGTGLIFYPGGKVETNAYAPLLCDLAQRGICCVAVDMPLHLAVLKPNAADDVIRQITGIDKWFICGHSLGGAMAAKYASSHQTAVDGLILLAAYPTDPISLSYPVLSICASKDGILDMNKYKTAKLLAPGMKEIVIEGGNHAQFGDYGIQKGDGAAAITKEEQWGITAEAIEEFCGA